MQDDKPRGLVLLLQDGCLPGQSAKPPSACIHHLAWSDEQISCVAGKEVDVIDGKNLRRLALAYKVPIITTVAGAKATTSALAGMQKGPLHQVPLQDYFPEAAERSTVEFKIVG